LEMTLNDEQAKLAIAVERKKRGALADTHARSAKLLIECASSVIQRGRNGKHFQSSEFW